MAPRVSVIILNWNGWKDTIECLESVYRSEYENYDVIVVDNGSSDDSIESIKRYSSGQLAINSKFFEYNLQNKPIRVFELGEENARKGKFNRPLYEKYDPDRRLILIRNRKNYGYAGGNNVGIKFAITVLNPDYVLVLNNDTVIPPELIKTLVKNALSNRCGLNSPLVLYYDFPSTIHNAGSILIPIIGHHRRLCHGKRIGNCRIDRPEFIEGSAILIKSDVLLDIGLFDESFFCYWEEIDLEIRTRKKDYSICSTSSIGVWHKIAKSSGGPKSEFYIHYYTRNRIKVFKKHFRGILGIHLLLNIIPELIIRTIQTKQKTIIQTYLRALREGLYQ